MSVPDETFERLLRACESYDETCKSYKLLVRDLMKSNEQWWKLFMLSLATNMILGFLLVLSAVNYG